MVKSVVFDPALGESVELAIDSLSQFPLGEESFPDYKIKMQEASPLPDEVTALSAMLLGNDDWWFRVDDEAMLFLLAVQHQRLEQRLIDLVERIIAHNKIVGRYKIPYSDSETPFGHSAAVALALHKKSHIKLYIRYLKTLDLNVEVYTAAAIHYLFELHGLCRETIELACARVLSCAGQWGIEQIADVFKGLKDAQVYSQFQQQLKFYDKDFPNKELFLGFFAEAMED